MEEKSTWRCSWFQMRSKEGQAQLVTRSPLSHLCFRLTARQPKDSMSARVLLALPPPSRSSPPAIPTRTRGSPACLWRSRCLGRRAERKRQLSDWPWKSDEIRLETTGNPTHVKFLDTRGKKISYGNLSLNIRDLVESHPTYNASSSPHPKVSISEKNRL